MKSYSLLFAFFALAPVLVIAQNQPDTRTSPGLTVTPSASSTLTNPNRQQELYDQYHGIVRKPRPEPTTLPSGNVSRSQPDRTERPTKSERPARPERTAPASVDVSTSAVRIGVRGGVTYPFYLEKLIGINQDPALGFTGGVVFLFGTGTLSFQPEINYTRTAYKLNQQDIFGPTTSAITQRYGFDFVEVPLLLKIASGDVNSSRVFINIGPYASYLLSASVEGKTQSLDGFGGRLGFGAAAGIGAALKAGPGHLTIEARGLYTLGNSELGFYTDSRVIQSQFTLGYMVPLGGR